MMAVLGDPNHRIGLAVWLQTDMVRPGIWVHEAWSVSLVSGPGDMQSILFTHRGGWCNGITG